MFDVEIWWDTHWVVMVTYNGGKEFAVAAMRNFVKATGINPKWIRVVPSKTDKP